MAEDKKTKIVKSKVPKASPKIPEATNATCWTGSPRKRFPGESNDVDLRYCSKEKLTLLKKNHPSYFTS